MKRWHVDIPYLVGFCVILSMEVVIALFIRDRFVRPYLGDVLVVVLLYCLTRTFWRTAPRLLPLGVCLFAMLVELFQYVHIVEWLHWEQYGILRIIMGSTFDVADLLCYAVGGALLFLWQVVENRWVDPKE
jgi:hypothetical protein